MDYAEFKSHFVGFRSNGPELYHLWSQGMTPLEAEEKLKVRGRMRGESWRGRGISNTNLKFALVKHIVQFCARMETRNLSGMQKQFIQELRERTLSMQTPLD